MLWLGVAVSAYLILAIVFLIDKYLLVGPIPHPKVYAFYIGVLGIFALVIAPFVGFYVPGFPQIALGLLAGIVFVLAIFWFLKAIKLFEVSRVVPAIGGILPIFSFLLVYVFSWGRETLSLQEFSAFAFLVAGSFLITYERNKRISRESLQLSVVAAFLLALSFVLSKYVYQEMSFWPGYIWIRIGGFLAALILFFSGGIKEELLKTKANFPKSAAALFFVNQTMGASANVLQNWAIALAPLVYVAVVNALQGVQYVFLLIFTVLLSLFFPQILKEAISKQIIIQKILAILLIAAGLVLLVLR